MGVVVVPLHVDDMANQAQNPKPLVQELHYGAVIVVGTIGDVMNTLLKSRIFCAPSARENLQKGNLMGASWPEQASRPTARWGNFQDF